MPPTLFDEEQVAESRGEPAIVADFPRVSVVTTREAPACEDAAQLPCDLRLRSGPATGALKWDPYGASFGRDGPRRWEPPAKEWSPDPLARYLRGVVKQIEQDMQNHGVPTAEKFDAFMSRLVVNLARHVKRAPKKRRQALQVLLSKRSFSRHEQQRATTPEELKSTLNSLIEDLLKEFAEGVPSG